MLTMFTTPKPFRGHIKVIQTNAIRSWALLRPQCEIILFGNEEGTADITSELGIRHIPEVGRNEYGMPLISSMFKTAQEVANHNLLCYANADVIFMSDFLPAVDRIAWQSFLVLGQRWDIDLHQPVDFSDPSWEEQLRARLAREARLHAPSGLDYFVFPKGMYPDIPPLTIGRAGWDNWMVYRARSQKIPVIDATKAITAVHQNHDYSHQPGGRAWVFDGPEAERNRELLGGYERSFCTKHANWILTPKGLRRALTVRHLCYRLDALPVLVPRLHFLGIPKRILIAFSKTIRSKLSIARK